MSDIRQNPPFSVVSEEELTEYHCLYDDITDNGVSLSYQDRHALGELAIAHCEMRMCRADIAQNGMSMSVQGDRNEIVKKNPAVDILAKLQIHVKALYKAFKMTPDARGKTSAKPGDNSKLGTWR